MKQKRFKLEVKNRIETIPEIVNFVNAALVQLGADSVTIHKVQLAVDEACTNIIMYAYSGEPGPLSLVIELVGTDLILTIEDKGKSFDPGMVPPPDLETDVNERKIGGLGVYLMKTLMDEVSYSSDAEKGNRLMLKIKLGDTPRPPAG